METQNPPPASDALWSVMVRMLRGSQFVGRGGPARSAGVMVASACLVKFASQDLSVVCAEGGGL